MYASICTIVYEGTTDSYPLPNATYVPLDLLEQLTANILVSIHLCFINVGDSASGSFCESGGSGGCGATPTNEEFPVNINEVPVDNLVPASELRVIPEEDVVQFRSNSPYASVLKKCALADEIA